MTVTVEYETEDHLNLPETQIIEEVVTEALDYENCPYEAEVNVLLTDNPSIQEINRQQRQIDSPTDVLSFPMIDYASPSDSAMWRKRWKIILIRRRENFFWEIL